MPKYFLFTCINTLGEAFTIQDNTHTDTPYTMFAFQQ